MVSSQRRKGAKKEQLVQDNFAPLRLCEENVLTFQMQPIITWTETDCRMMARALELAKKGVGQVSPGPLVGCVVVSPAGEIVGEGYYLFEAVKHAETIALDLASEKARGCTAYVSLEPNAHHGPTSPCTEALRAAGI